MTYRNHDCSDLDQLLRLIGILGSPGERDFWTRWRPNEHGYGYKKIKGGIAALARSEGHESHDRRTHDFADYILMLFATDSPEGEARLVDLIGRNVTSGHTRTVGLHFLSDLRNTAWRVWRDHHYSDAATVIQQWADAPDR